MKAGEWLYLCVAHGNDGAMEVRIRIPILLTVVLSIPHEF